MYHIQRIIVKISKNFFENRLHFFILYVKIAERYAPVAQLDRVTDYESVGRGFESLLAYHAAKKTSSIGRCLLFLILHCYYAFFNIASTSARG